MSETKVPFDRSKTWPLVAAILLNLIPVVGVLFWGWSAFALIVLYWLENLVIGVRTVLSMLVNAALTGGVNWVGAIFFGAFFTLHYGLFCFGHGVFVMLFFGSSTNGETILDLAAGVRDLFAAQANLLIGFASIVLWQIIQFVIFVASGQAKRTNVLALMGEPYPRIIALHLTIIFGGFILMALNQPIAGVAILALVKMAYDVGQVLKPAQAEPAAPVSATS